MKKIILDFNVPETPELVQEYLMDKFEFPDWYGKNLDALYDCLTSIAEPTAVGFYIPDVDFDEEDHELKNYIEKVRKVFEDAEEYNTNLAVIYA